jgi:hypothetical protein
MKYTSSPIGFSKETECWKCLLPAIYGVACDASTGRTLADSRPLSVASVEVEPNPARHIPPSTPILGVTSDL